jgi:hypothetical protein
MSEQKEQPEYNDAEKKLRTYFIKRINRTYPDLDECNEDELEKKSTVYLNALSDFVDLSEGREGLRTNKEKPAFFTGPITHNANNDKTKKIDKKENKAKTNQINTLVLEAFDKRFRDNSRVNKFGKQAEILRMYQSPKDRIGRLC